jgi:hypothetical protein
MESLHSLRTVKDMKAKTTNFPFMQIYTVAGAAAAASIGHPALARLKSSQSEARTKTTAVTV